MEFVFRPSWLSFFYWLVTAAWLGEFFAFPSKKKGGSRDLWCVFAILSAAPGLTGFFYVKGWGNVPDDWIIVFRAEFLALYAIGVGLRYWAALRLGENFSREIHVSPDQILAESGPYKFWRHPLYLGLFLISLGMNGVMGNVPGVVAAGLATAGILMDRIRREERELEKRLGERYLSWKRERSLIFPSFLKRRE